MVEVTQADMREAVARALAKHDRIEICSDASYALSSYGPKADAALSIMQPEIDRRVAEERAKSAAMQDLAYFNGAKQYATIAAQSEDAAREWLQNGCGNRQSEAIKALAQFEKENSHEQG